MSSTQAYYKDRLGFDPREAIYDGPPQEKYRRKEEKPHGYEENLTKFKGTTIWELFIGATSGTVVDLHYFNAWSFSFGWSWFVRNTA